MLSEADPLLPVARASGNCLRRLLCCPTIRIPRRYKNTCVTTKGALLALIWSGMVNIFGLGLLFVYTVLPHYVVHLSNYLAIYCYYVIGMLMFPLFGLIGEVLWTKFNMMMVGSLTILLGFISNMAETQLIPHNNPGYEYFLYLPFLLLLPGIGMFQANVLQYSVDQLYFASSEVVSSFVHWYYWTCYVFPLLPLFDLSLFNKDADMGIGITSAAGVVIFGLLCVCVWCCYRDRKLTTDSGNRVNPVMLIWKVLRYARSHRHPLFRSAFTYSEIPSRLDLAKQRYGGPFTTEEVEDVKSFWRILLVLLSLVGFQLRDDNGYTKAMLNSLHVPNDVIYLYDNTNYTSSWTVSALMIVVSIPVYQFIIRPSCLSKYVPKMLTRMFLGLLAEFISLLLTTIYSTLILFAIDSVVNSTITNHTSTGVYICSVVRNHTSNPFCSDSTADCSCEHSGCLYPQPVINYYMLIIPQALNGLSHMLVFLTALEFILAQAPRTVQGFLIGIWYSLQSVQVVISIVEYLTCGLSYWEYYVSKTACLLFTMAVFVLVARNYKYRQLNEDVDINIQQRIEDVFERDFERKSQCKDSLEEDTSEEDSEHYYRQSVHSV